MSWLHAELLAHCWNEEEQDAEREHSLQTSQLPLMSQVPLLVLLVLVLVVVVEPPVPDDELVVLLPPVPEDVPLLDEEPPVPLADSSS